TPDGGALCSGPGRAPSGPLIANFDDGTGGLFGRPGVDPVAGMANVSGPLRSDWGNGNWHIAGNYGTAPVFFPSWGCPRAATGACALDLSRYQGIQFTIRGTVPEGAVDLAIGSRFDDGRSPTSVCGTCDNTNPTACFAPRLTVPVPAGGAETR